MRLVPSPLPSPLPSPSPVFDLVRDGAYTYTYDYDYDWHSEWERAAREDGAAGYKWADADAAWPETPPGYREADEQEVLL